MEKSENLTFVTEKLPDITMGWRANLPVSREWLLKHLVVIFSVYTGYLLMLLTQSYFNYKWRGASPPNWLEEVGFLAVWSYTWALLTPALFIFSERFPISRRYLARNISYHLFIGVLLVGFHRAVILSFASFILKVDLKIGETFASQFYYLLHHVTDGLFTYIFILAIHQAFLYFRESQAREFRLQQAELEALKMQLHPHFLFNTLNAISALVYYSPPDATKTISQLSDLLRLTLHNNKAQEVTLKEELDFLRKYIQIQQTLLQERLEIEWRIEPETLDALVPNMLLQPLVENSIRHGIAPKEDGGRVEILSNRVGDDLLLEIKDNGIGSESEQNNNGGRIGLTNSKARLKHLYGEAQKFEISAPLEGGWCVKIMIPYREPSQK